MLSIDLMPVIRRVKRFDYMISITLLMYLQHLLIAQSSGVVSSKNINLVV